MRKKKLLVTKLSERDRKVLNKYTGYYTNFIESNTSKNEVLDEYNYEEKN